MSRVFNINDGDSNIFSDITLDGLTITNGLTTEDSADGGGIRSSENLTVSNSIVSGNSTSGDYADGGGIYSNDVSLSVSNSTVSGNSTSGDGADGGGIFTFNGDLSVESSIIASNTTNAAGPDLALLSFSTASGSNNIIGVGDDTGPGAFNITNGVNGNQVGTAASPLDPLLSPLQNNGGPTFTQSPLPGSPAIDMGANPQGLLTDQRGLPREVGQTDIGAVEVQPVTEPPTAVPEPTSVISLALMGAVLGRRVISKRQNKSASRVE